MITTGFGSPWGASAITFGAAKKVVAKKKAPAKIAPKATAKAVASSKAEVKRLQTALVTLGKVTGSATLKAIKIDGAMGAKTVAAVNWAFTNHVGSGQAPAQYRSGALTQVDVLTNIGTLSSLLETEIKRRGSAAPSAAVAKQAELVKAIKTAPVPVSKEIAKRLQTALANLGKATGSATLKAVKADGAVGAKTVAAVNWAFTNHIGSGQAPAEFRTGRLDLDTVKGQAGVLAKLIEAEVVRRKGTTPTPAQITTSDARAAAAIPVSKAAAKDLQTALVNLGKVAGSAPLKSVKVDGALGPATVTAVNWAFTKHVGSGQAPANLRTGTLTLVDVKRNVSQLIQLLYAETRRRGGGANVPTTTTVPLKTKGGKVVQAKYKGAEKYEVTDEAGQTYDTSNPTDEASPKSAPAATTEAEEEIAAEEAPKKAVVKPATTRPAATAPSSAPDAAAEETTAMIPGAGTPRAAAELAPESVGSESFISQYKWPLLGGIAVLGIGAALLLRKRSSGSDGRASNVIPMRTTQRRRAA